MSTTVDNRVLEMRFDNKQFESGVATTMSTLDKLKKKLNLSGASKGLETVGKATKGINFSGMTVGIDQVKSGMVSLSGISAGVIAKFTVINNMCNSLLRTGKRMVSALTIDPVHTGFQEYETQIGAIQTILSNTRQEGTNVEIVNRALDELNEYADKTIYNFTEMTRNIGTFTAAGVKLDTSVSAIKGIANLAAVSGSTSQQASTAMYQLSQALAAGKVSLMDWNSVVNAGMGGKLFQDALIRTSELLGTGAKQAIETEGSFRESLTKSGWLTTEVLTETLNQLSGAYSKADLMAQGFSEEQASEIAALAKDAEDAATKVKTFTQLWDVMKEAAQSGWAQTWRILVGDFEEAKSLFTPLADFFTGIIGKFSDTRNALLQSSFATNIRDMFESVDNSVNKLLEPVDNIKEAFADLGAIVDEVILGKFGNGQTRFDALTESGYNWMEVQNKVNEKLNNGFRYTEDQISAQDKLLGSQKKIIKSTENISEATEETEENTQKLTDAEKHRLQQIAHLSEAQMRANGYTEEQITAMRDLRKVADQLGIPIVELIANLDNLNGRWIAIESFKNIGQAILKVFSSLGGAWSDVFAPIQPESIFNAITAFHKFTETLILSDGNAEKLRSTFKGLFSILDLVTSIAGGGAKFAFKAISSILGAFNLNVLDITSSIGEAIYSFNEWITSENIIAKELDNFVSKLPGYANRLKTWFDAFKETPMIQSFLDAIENIKKAFSDFSIGEIDSDELARKLGENLANALKAIPKAAIQIGKDVITGFQNGLEEGISEGIIGKIISFCNEFIASFAEALGVQSPSWKTHDIAVDTIQGFINGLKEMLGPVLDFVSYIGNQIVKGFKFIWDLVTDESGNIEWDKIFAGGMITSGLFLVKKFVDAVDGISDAIGGIGDILEGAGDALKNFSKVLKSYAWDIKAKAIQKIAISIAILSAAVFALSKIENPGKLWNAVGVIGALAAIVLALSGAMELMSKASITYEKGKLNIEGLKASILQIGATLLMLGFVVKIIGEMKPDDAKAGFIALTGLMVEVIVFMAVVGQVVKGGAAENIDKVGKLMTKLAIAMILMTAVVKLASGLSPDEMFKGAVFATAFGLFAIAITKVAKSAGNNVGKVGGMILKITFAMGLMVGVVKLIDTVSAAEALKGAAFATAFGIFVRALVKSTTIGKQQQIAAIGGLVLSMSISLGLMVGVVKLVGKLSAGEILKGVAFVGAFILFVKALVKIVNVGNEGQMIKVGGTLLALSAAIGILAGVSVLLGLIDIAQLAKGVIAVGLLSVFMAGMVNGLKGAQNVQKTIMMLAVSIGVMAGAVVALSLIDAADLAAATIALGSLMGMFALMEKSMSGMKDVKIGPLIVMTAVVGALGGILAILASLNPGPSIEIAASISVLMLALSKSLEMIDNVGRISKNTLKSMAVLGAIAVGMGLILTGLSKLKPGPTLEIASSMSEVLIAMSTSAFILSKVGPMGAIAAKGAAALIAVVAGAGAILGVVGGIIGLIPGAEEFLNNGIPIIAAIGRALGSLIGGVIGGIGEGITGSLPAMIQDINVFLTGVQTASLIASTIKGDSFDGVGAFVKAMAGISLGSLVEKFASGIMGESSMEAFSKNAISFVKAMASISMILTAIPINDEAIAKVAKCGMLFSELANSLPKSGGLLQDIVGEQDLEGFGDKVKAFADEMLKVNKAVSGEGFTFNEAAITAITAAGTKFSELANSLPKTGSFVAKSILGEKDLSAFGKAVKTFVDELKKVNIALGEDFTLNEAAIESLITAGNKFVELQAALPRTGGWDDTIMGKDDLATFGETVGAFLDAMEKLKTGMGENGISDNVVTSVTNAGEAIIELQKALPKEGWFDGKMDLDTFSGYVNKFATAMGEFATTAATMKPDAIDTAITTAYRIKNLINALSEIEDLGAANTFSGVGAGDGSLVNIGQAIGKFGDAVSGIDIDKVNIAVSISLQIKRFIDNLSGFDPSGVNNFKIVPLGKSIQGYSSSVSGIDVGAINSSISAMEKIKAFISSLSGFDSSGVSSFKTAISSLVKTDITSLTSAFNNSSSQLSNAGSSMIDSLTSGFSSNSSELTSAASSTVTTMLSSISGKGLMFRASGTTLMTHFINGIKAKANAVSSAVGSIASSAANTSNQYYSTFYLSGVHLVNGFVAGISGNIQQAANAAASMAAAASDAARRNLKINSPSKVFKEIGSGVPEGFAMGIGELGSMVKKSVTKMSDKAINGTRSAMLKMDSLLNGEINTQPTIRPVLDLSDIQSGVGSLDSMIGGDRMLNVISDLNSIGNSISNRSQSSTDIIDAINSLGKKLTNTNSGSSYVINGVTYDDGHNVANAVQTIVKAAKIGRRM